ncbi:MAG: glucose PTS transporter subunit EIIB, partial [Amphiplicatus sp.]
ALNLKTPGRDAVATPEQGRTEIAGGAGRGFIEALGGAGNIAAVDACTTRLRLVVSDQAAVDEAKLKTLGARGVIRPSATTLQVVLGPIADQTASEIKVALAQSPAVTPSVSVRSSVVEDAPQEPSVNVEPILSALGGAANIRAIKALSSRLILSVCDAASVDETKLTLAGARGVVRLERDSMHLLFGPGAGALARAIEARLQPPLPAPAE